jgi:hypothetical protein
MKKSSIVSFATATSLAALFAASSAFGAQNVANTTQKGSLLVWPLVTTDTSTTGEYGPQDTEVEISNDAYYPITVECEYVNETKGRVDFNFVLSGKQTASWDVGTQSGDQVSPPPFPSIPTTGGDPNRGELVCFATAPDLSTQVAWNELTGTATVINLDTTSATEPKESFKYNAWAFAARCTISESCTSGVAPDDATDPQGTPGTLTLSGGGSGTYDGCPAYNVANFMPNGASLGNVSATFKNDLAVVSCNIDLREQYSNYNTKLEFTVWNSDEDALTGAYACVNTANTVNLGNSPPPSEPKVVNGSNFNESTLKTPNARFEVQSISANPPCPGSTSQGLLGVIESSTAIAGDKGADSLVGNTTQGAGVQAGFVDWNPSTGVQQKPRG